LLRPDIPREVVLDTQRTFMDYLMNLDMDKEASQIIGKTAYTLVAEALGVSDPYA